MFESLSERLGKIFEGLTGRGALNEADVDAALREVEARVREILNSTSWKVTGPLRLCSAMLRGSRNDASAYLRETLLTLSGVPALKALARRVLPESGRLRRALAARIAMGRGPTPLPLAAPKEIGIMDAATSERERLINKMAGRIRDDRLRRERTK